MPCEDIDSFCEMNGFTGWIEVSVKKNYNLDRTARCRDRLRHYRKCLVGNGWTDRQTDRQTDKQTD